MNPVRRAVVKSALTAAFLGFAVLFVIVQIQNHIVYDIDARLDKSLLQAAHLEAPDFLEAGILPAMKLPYRISQTPRLSIGFDQPPMRTQKFLFREDHYQLVSDCSNLQFDFFSFMEMTHAQIRIYTNDRILKSRLSQEIPHLIFEENLDIIKTRLQTSKTAFALLNVKDIDPQLRTLSPIFPVRVWVGWEENKSLWLQQIGANYHLNRKLDHLLSQAIFSKRPKITRVKAVGDVMLGRRIGSNIKWKMNSEPSYPFTHTKSFLADADLTMGNLECTVSKRGKPLPGKDYTFRADPSVIERLKQAGFDAMILANNHTKDYGSDALTDTLTHLSDAGLHNVGAGKNYRDARKPTFVDLEDGSRLGLLAYSMVMPKGFFPTRKENGVNYVVEKTFAEEIKNAKNECDILIVNFHWGKEYKMNPIQSQKEYGRKAIDYGADLVIGHHPHWNQTFEFYQKGFIAYSLGNFVFDMTHRPKVTEGMILTAEFLNHRLYQVKLDPVHLRHGQPELAHFSSQDKRRRDSNEILSEIIVASQP